MTTRRLPEMLSRMGIAGGAVYDALVALAAVEPKVDLATRDAQARDTFVETVKSRCAKKSATGVSASTLDVPGSPSG